VYDTSDIDFALPGVHHYQLAFHLDSSWGYSLVPLTVINGLRRPASDVPPPAVAAFGGTHGNEYEGQVAVTRLCEDLDPNTLCGTVILMPQLSETACRAGARVSPEDGVNMNRAFPGSRHGTISARIAQFVTTEILTRVQVVLDLHSGGHEAVYPICTSFHPLDDPDQLSETAAVALLFDTPFIFIYSSDMASGLLTDQAEREGKVTVGGEFGVGEATSPKGTRHVYEGVKNVLRHYGLLNEPVVKIDSSRSEPPRFVQAPSLEDYRPCPRSGVWEPVLSPGATVHAGDLIGRLHDFDEHPARALEIRAHRDGVLIASYHGARCPRGATLFVIAQDTEIAISTEVGESLNVTPRQHKAASG
jgi:predicted deacylase